MHNYEVVHHFFSQDDRKIMGKKNDLVVVDKNKGMWFYITHDGCPMIGDAQVETKAHFFSIGGYCEWEEVGSMSVAEVYELNLLFVRLYGYVVDDLLTQHEQRGTLRTTRKKYIHQKEL